MPVAPCVRLRSWSCAAPLLQPSEEQAHRHREPQDERKLGKPSRAERQHDDPRENVEDEDTPHDPLHEAFTFLQPS
jgi:hypothetical protein